jgi:hypothetical protein
MPGSSENSQQTLIFQCFLAECAAATCHGAIRFTSRDFVGDAREIAQQQDTLKQSRSPGLQTMLARFAARAQSLDAVTGLAGATSADAHDIGH